MEIDFAKLWERDKKIKRTSKSSGTAEPRNSIPGYLKTEVKETDKVINYLVQKVL